MRGENYNHICNRLHEHIDSDWLLIRRSSWVSVDGNGYSRNSLRAGRTGTRLNIGRPQVRWEDGIINARAIQEADPIAAHGRSARTIGTIIHESISFLRDSLAPIVSAPT